MPKQSLEYLKHIRDECKYIISVTGEDLSKDEFLDDETLKGCSQKSGDHR